MPYKKRKRKQPTQSQRQSQKVIVNIGSKSAPRKRSGRGGLPPPSHMHNLAPTFVTAPQVDYTPLLMAITQQTRSLQPEPVRNPVTPLSSVIQSLPAQQMAGAAAIRRAGKTAANFQPSALMERLDMLLEDKNRKLQRELDSPLLKSKKLCYEKNKRQREYLQQIVRQKREGFVPRVVFEKK
jgi:hypothetical protein